MSQDPQEPSDPTRPQPPQPYAYPGRPPQAQPSQPYPGRTQPPYPPQPYQPYPGPTQQQPGPAQQPYPATPYGAPAQYPYQAGQPYGQQPQNLPAQPTAYGATYPATSYRAPAKRRSPALGIVGFAIVALTGVLAVVLGLSMAGTFAELMTIIPPGTTRIDASMVPPEMLEALGLPMSGLMMTGFVGLIGWVISIVAAATNRGRGWGVAGIILGVLAPIAAVFAMSLAAAMAMS